MERNPVTPSTADIRQRALSNLEYIRGTVEAAGSFTAIPGRGAIAMGILALLASAVATMPALEEHWLAVWACAAVFAIPAGVLALVAKLRSRHQTMLHGSARRFLLTLAPSLAAAAVLTVGLIRSGNSELIVSLWLLGYGAGIAATGSFTARPVTLMGLSFMLLGALALFTPHAWGNLMLAAGFGGLHIAFGIWIAWVDGE